MIARMKVDTKSLNRLNKELERLALEAPNAFGAALYAMGVKLEQGAKRRTPVDTGFLRASAYTTPPMRGKITETTVQIGERPKKGHYNTPAMVASVTVSGGTQISVEVGYAAEYAVEVHEKTWVSHKVGEAKFLQNAVNEIAPDFKQKLADTARRFIRTGIAARLTRGYTAR